MPSSITNERWSDLRLSNPCDTIRPRMSRALVIGLIAGSLLRAAVLTSPGSPDLHTWKAWSYTAAIDPLGLYGTGGSPPERRVLRWAEVTGTTEYLPLGIYELGVAGIFYRAIDPPYRDSAW